MVARGRRQGAPVVEPRQDLLAGRGLHEGRPDRLLLQRGAPDAAAPGRTAAHDEADARRHRRAVLLREVGALTRPGLDRPVQGAVRRREDRRHRLHDDRGRRRTAVHREPRLHRVPSAALALRGRRASRLPLLRPGPVPAVHVRGRADGGTAHQGAARSARPGRVPQDVRGDGVADLRADRARALHLRPGARARGSMREADPAGRPRPRDDGVEDRGPHRQDLHRSQHEPIGREHRGRVLDASRDPSARLDAAHVGRGRAGRVRAAGLPDRERVGTVRARGRPVRRHADRGRRPDDRVRGLGDRRDRRRRRPRLDARPRRSSPRRRIRTSPSTSASATSRAPPNPRPAPPRARGTRS